MSKAESAAIYLKLIAYQQQFASLFPRTHTAIGDMEHIEDVTFLPVPVSDRAREIAEIRFDLSAIKNNIRDCVRRIERMSIELESLRKTSLPDNHFLVGNEIIFLTEQRSHEERRLAQFNSMVSRLEAMAAILYPKEWVRRAKEIVIPGEDHLQLSEMPEDLRRFRNAMFIFRMSCDIVGYPQAVTLFADNYRRVICAAMMALDPRAASLDDVFAHMPDTPRISDTCRLMLAAKSSTPAIHRATSVALNHLFETRATDKSNPMARWIFGDHLGLLAVAPQVFAHLLMATAKASERARKSMLITAAASPIWACQLSQVLVAEMDRITSTGRSLSYEDIDSFQQQMMNYSASALKPVPIGQEANVTQLEFSVAA